MGAPTADPPPSEGQRPTEDGANNPLTKNRKDSTLMMGLNTERDESNTSATKNEESQQNKTVKWGDREDVNDSEWHEVETRQQKKRNKLREIKRNKTPTNNEEAPTSTGSKKSTYKAPSYLTKVQNKLGKSQKYVEVNPSNKTQYAEFYEYAQKHFAILPKLRPKKPIEVKILDLMKSGTMQFKVLPTFLTQIFSSKTIARLQTFLTKQHSSEMYAQLSPGYRLSADLPDYAIMRNVCTDGEVPQSILDNIQSFKIDATDVYYIAARRILVFRFASKTKADFWDGKELPYQNKPITFSYYFNNEAHQQVPPALKASADLSKATTAAEQLQIIESCKTKARYRFAIVNAPPLFQHAHLTTLLEDTLHLKIGSLSPAINSQTGTVFFFFFFFFFFFLGEKNNLLNNKK